ncbi:hypothetical protein WDW89_21830 [Deltaproteobacteria bacterium TL4]
MPTSNAQEALKYLRDPGHFQWYVIPMFVLVVYIYAVEIEKRNWNVVFAGLAVIGMDWFNELWNSLLFHFNQFAPAWGTPGGNSAYQIFIGFNIEIQFLFAVAGIVGCKVLPQDPHFKIFGLSNRIFLAVTYSVICVFIEMILNAMGVLTWDLSWWNRDFPIFIVLIGYLPFYLVAYWVHDMNDVKKQATTVAGIMSFDLLGFFIFGRILGWI